MNNIGNWEQIKEIGAGGQGRVYLARDTRKYNENTMLKEVIKNITVLNSSQTPETHIQNARTFIRNLELLNHGNDSGNVGALKVLHQPSDSRNPDDAEARIRKEIAAHAKINHPNILKLLDHDNEGKWFVGEYLPNGPLSKNLHLFQGNFLGALEAIRPLVEGVSLLHKNGLVHRDIKSGNIFIANDRSLILGDLGLVFFTDETHSRISATFENVGSRDWMPPWAMGMRLQDVRPTFDIFCLGKVLWAMVSGKPILPLWYFDKEQFNVEKIFPKNPEMKWAREIFRQCIVEEESNCIATADDFLEQLNKVISAVRRHADVVKEGVVRQCAVCGLGKYEYVVNENGAQSNNFGIQPSGMAGFKIFTCDHCGHVQMFYISDIANKRPLAWKKE